MKTTSSTASPNYCNCPNCLTLNCSAGVELSEAKKDVSFLIVRLKKANENWSLWKKRYDEMIVTCKYECDQPDKLKANLTDALPILREYARRNPRYTALDGTTQDPNGVHKLLAALTEDGK